MSPSGLPFENPAPEARRVPCTDNTRATRALKRARSAAIRATRETGPRVAADRTPRGLRHAKRLADAVRLEHASVAGHAVVHEHVHQGMAEPARSASLLVPDDLLGDLSGVHEAQAHRRTAGDVNPRAPERDEAIRHQLVHGRLTTSPDCKLAAGEKSRRFCSEIRAHVAESAQKLSIQSTHEWCDFSLPASRTAARSSSFSKASRPACRSISTPSPATSGAARAATGAAAAWRSSPTAREILSGVRAGETIGSPIAMMIENRDWANWQYTMRVDAEEPPTSPMPAAAAPRRRSRGRAPAMPTSQASPSTAAPTCATSSSARARAKPRRASRPAPSPASCWPTRASASPATSSRSARPALPPDTVVTLRAGGRAAGRLPGALRRRRGRTRG